MKNFFFILISLCFYNVLNAQQKFSESIGGTGNDEALYCKPTRDGGYINVGWTTSYGAGNWDLYLVKTTAQGELMWTKTYGGTGDEADCSVEQTSDNGYIIASRTNSFGVGSSDIYIVKTDSVGNLMWSKTYGGSSWEEGHSILILNDGFLHTGFTSSFGAGNDDIYLMKSDFSGNIIWSKTFGGTGSDHGHKVKRDLDGNFLIAGATNSFNTSKWDFYLLKIDTQGALMWSQTYGGTEDDFGWDVQPMNDGYFIAGYTKSFGQGANDFLLIKTNTSGNVQWSKTFGGAENDLAYALEKTTDNNLLITGETASFGNGDEDIFLIKTDNLGNTIWASTFGGSLEDGSQYAQNANDGGYIVSGYTQSFGGGNWDFYMIKTDIDGHAETCNQNEINIAPVSQNAAHNSPLTLSSSPSFLTGTNPNTIVSSGGQNYACSPLAIEEYHQFTFELFPIPTHDKISIKYVNETYGLNAQVKYGLCNIQGQTVLNGSFDCKENGTYTIDIASLNPGIYFITLVQNELKTYNQKLIKY